MTDQVYVSVPINAHELADAFVSAADRDQATAFILAIDLAIADAGFTEELLLKLASSLSGDLEPNEWADLCRKIAEFK